MSLDCETEKKDENELQEIREELGKYDFKWIA